MGAKQSFCPAMSLEFNAVPAQTDPRTNHGSQRRGSSMGMDNSSSLAYAAQSFDDLSNVEGFEAAGCSTA
jgi:hypothetical protein